MAHRSRELQWDIPSHQRWRVSFRRCPAHGAAALSYCRLDLSASRRPGKPVTSGAHKRTIRVVAAVVEQDARYLITQRRASAVLPLLWEFPGGRVEDCENDADALKRHLFHRLGVQISVGISTFTRVRSAPDRWQPRTSTRFAGPPVRLSKSSLSRPRTRPR
ncbi:MAG: NUDIX domain-containing protein [Polyangiaceae bacterium]